MQFFGIYFFVLFSFIYSFFQSNIRIAKKIIFITLLKYILAKSDCINKNIFHIYLRYFVYVYNDKIKILSICEINGFMIIHFFII